MAAFEVRFDRTADKDSVAFFVDVSMRASCIDAFVVPAALMVHDLLSDEVAGGEQSCLCA